MTDATSARTAAGMRALFDASFAQAPALERDAGEFLLGVRAGGLALALRAAELAAVMRCPPLSAVPSRHPALRGLAGVRGTIVGVYELATLVGEPSGTIVRGWIVTCAADRTVAFAFEDLVAYARARSDEIHTTSGPNGAHRRVVRLADVECALLDVDGLLATMNRTAESGPWETDRS